MKNLMLVCALFVSAMPAFADHNHNQNFEAVRIAQSLEGNLNQLATDGLREGDRLAQAGDNFSSAEADRVSEQAGDLARLVHREVYRSLFLGYSEEDVARRFQALDRDFGNLRYSTERLANVAPNLSVTLQRVLSETQALSNSLVSAPATASCSIKTGGNFFTPKSHVECTVFGKGAIGYEAVIRGRQGQTATVHGNLAPGQTNFATDKVQVGYQPSFEMYLVMRNGARVLVAQQP